MYTHFPERFPFHLSFEVIAEREIKQPIAIEIILLVSRLQLRLQFGFELRLQLCELVEDLHDARLDTKRGDGEREAYQLLDIDRWKISNDKMLFTPFIDEEEVVKHKLGK